MTSVESTCAASHLRNVFFVPEPVTYNWFKSTCDMLDGEIPVVSDLELLHSTHDEVLGALNGMKQKQNCKIAPESATFYVGQM